MPLPSPSPDDGSKEPTAEVAKPYSAPVLIEYGSIRQLTRSGGDTRTEGNSGRQRRN
jgi:hypothetical protein